MGRHSARPRIRVHGMRLMTNTSLVLLLTALSCLVMYVGIATYANARLVQSLEPTSVAASSPASAETPIPTTHANAGSSASDDVVMRTCPATGCQAATCHAETGEPTPGR